MTFEELLIALVQHSELISNETKTGHNTNIRVGMLGLKVADILRAVGHTHGNKSIIDQLTQSDLEVLSKLSIVDGRLQIDADAYSTGELSAYGIGESLGSTGGYKRLDDWLQYEVNVTEGWVLSALLGKSLHDRISNIENSETTDDKHFIFNQGTPSDNWIISHNLNKYPSVVVVDSANTEVVGDVEFIDLNTIKIKFASGFSGRAFCN